MKSVSNSNIAILCRVLLVLIEAVSDNRRVRVVNSARMANIVLRRLQKINKK